MIASENDALRGAKVGGVGDVLLYLPRALAALGLRTTVLIPSYGFLHRENPCVLKGTVSFPFAGETHQAEIWEAEPKQPSAGVAHYILHHPAIGGEPIYYNDPPKEAFSRDGAKYALFCAAAGAWCAGIEGEYRLHLHDWHTGVLFLLRDRHPAFAHLRNVRTAFTIHNLVIQGTRPMTGPGSTVERWFPELFKDRGWVASWADPRFNEPCFTPMAAGIRHADRVNTVSPGYAREILLPSDPARGFYGGEGLEGILRDAADAGRLSGILNGTDYPVGARQPAPSFDALCALVEEELLRWSGRSPDPLHAEMRARIAEMRAAGPPRMLLTSVTRVVEQKLRLLFEPGSAGAPAVDAIDALLERRGGLYIVQGSGTAECEELLAQASRRCRRVIFLKGYSEPIARVLFGTGDLFLMPSSFEPCGISQMMAMRERQPCVVHAVGGLKDTVRDGVTGFTFSAASPAGQSDGFVAAVGRALELFFASPSAWDAMRDAAGAERFTWERAAREYVEKVYA
jgi:starch synthase